VGCDFLNSSLADKGTNLAVVYFDGVCNLCNKAVNFLLRIDRREKLFFASLQSSLAEQKLGKMARELNSIVFQDNDGRTYTESTAVIKILTRVGGVWRFAAIFWVVPRFIRDFFYRFIAQRRYRLFGKSETCRVPSAKEKSRFLT